MQQELEFYCKGTQYLNKIDVQLIKNKTLRKHDTKQILYKRENNLNHPTWLGKFEIQTQTFAPECELFSNDITKTIPISLSLSSHDRYQRFLDFLNPNLKAVHRILRVLQHFDSDKETDLHH